MIIKLLIAYVIITILYNASSKLLDFINSELTKKNFIIEANTVKIRIPKLFTLELPYFITLRYLKPNELFDSLSKPRRLWKIISYVIIPVGVIGIGAIIVLLSAAVYNMVSTPISEEVGKQVELLLPNKEVPGTDFILSPVYFLIFFFLIASVHEFMHGIIARVEGVKLDSVGFGLLGIFPLGFVEPNEEGFESVNSWSKIKMITAGVVGNLVFFLTILVFLKVLIFTSSTYGFSLKPYAGLLIALSVLGLLQFNVALVNLIPLPFIDGGKLVQEYVKLFTSKGLVRKVLTFLILSVSSSLFLFTIIYPFIR